MGGGEVRDALVLPDLGNNCKFTMRTVQKYAFYYCKWAWSNILHAPFLHTFRSKHCHLYKVVYISRKDF